MSRVRIILQARTSSARLPAKVLLPVGGLPLALLCASRLGAGFDLVLATSVDPTDDILANLAGNHGISVHRGPLDNVAQRFIGASSGLSDETVVVRATADNPVPDATLVRDMIDDFSTSRASYLGPNSYVGAAYGLCVEVFRLGAFRRSVEGSVDSAVAEHVTTKMRGAHTQVVANPTRFTLPGLEGLRVTVDTFDEYILAARAFTAFEEPVRARWADVARRFATLAGNSPESAV